MTRQPLFPGKDYVHQLRLITEFAARFPKMPPSAIDLLERMLIFDPNRRISVDEALGHVYLSVITAPRCGERTNLINVFESFLPQLLLYPNPSDPFNGEAASLLMRDRPAYELKVKEYCKRYAKPEDIGAPEEISSDDDDDDSMSERGSDSDDNDEIAGKADP
ncbi:hypothetical protein F2Q68_00001921 [Brassica cretica]|uniref:UBC core domain-containing protein n=1 Tax=Brassica cretica TaxID=69181 RepID=A0A8S9JEL7_BRACR|nr:hypothetical protein F2Q68_00001921 [Brassica cretica]